MRNKQIREFDVARSPGFLLAKAYQAVQNIGSELLAPFGITQQQAGVLAFLWKHGELSQAQLCCEAGIDRTTMTGIIDRLERDGYVCRTKSATDRRLNIIQPTTDALTLKEQLLPLIHLAQNTFLAGLSDKESAELCRLLAILSGRTL
jgi:DNA-binding MarR family transcriptional regulator